MGQYNVKVIISGGLFSTTGPATPNEPRPEGIVSEKLFSGKDRRVVDGPEGAVAFLNAQKAYMDSAPEDDSDQPAAIERGEQPDDE